MGGGDESPGQHSCSHSSELQSDPFSRDLMSTETSYGLLATVEVRAQGT